MRGRRTEQGAIIR